jgi:type II secretory ATPase GspE/PulE/Tfp pilus assembly ATPase PilB-like protein
MSALDRRKQLGMPYGTATHRLKRSVMLMLLQRLSEDVCHVCGDRLDETYTIEHKLPWEGRDTSLFWDLDNIAFSHAKCNTPHVRGKRPAAQCGSDAKYTRHACRCEMCTTAHAERMRKYRKHKT